MTFLISNDDGINAPGLAQLVDAIADMAECLIVAPDRNRSGIGHAVTFDRSISVSEHPDHARGSRRIAVDGTPADAVKFGIKQVLSKPPALAVTGINDGPNLGVNVLYSGTVGAALEANIHGVSSVSVSVGRHGKADPEALRHYIQATIRIALAADAKRLCTSEDSRPFCLNLNIPALPFHAIKGLRLTRHGVSGFDEMFHVCDPASPDQYRIDGEMVMRDADDSYDAYALQAGFASVTPLHIDLTHRELFASLSASDGF